MNRIETPIPRSLFLEGLIKSASNGDKLSEIAQFLQSNQRYQYATYLAYMGTEEYGKALLFMDDILDKTKTEITSTRWKKYYTSHEKKITKKQPTGTMNCVGRS